MVFHVTIIFMCHCSFHEYASCNTVCVSLSRNYSIVVARDFKPYAFTSSNKYAMLL